MCREADPRVTLFLQNSLRSYRHELLVGNCSGIPILQQHGSMDDNVPVFHSRRMSQLLSESRNEACKKYIELKGKNHWFDGIMCTPALQKFYSDILAGASRSPQLPERFSIVVADPADMASRGGIVVDQLRDPDQLGSIEVNPSSTSDVWTLTTSNILRFHIRLADAPRNLSHDITIDKTLTSLPLDSEKRAYWLVRSDDESWHVSMNT